MSQPRYSPEELVAWSNDILADELVSWAEAREYVSKKRMGAGKDPLDAKLLREAARRLRIK
jgi:hypothetical protein